jgi:hypothetical protein
LRIPSDAVAAMQRLAALSLLLFALAVLLGSACGLAAHNSRPSRALAVNAATQYKSTGSTSSDQRTLRASFSSPTRGSQLPKADCNAPRCGDDSNN